MACIWSGCAGPQGFICPRCGHAGGWRTGRGLLLCAACRRTASVTAGTIFEGTRTPLRTWFAACWYVTSQKQGASALGLKQALSLGSYQTAWAMLHRLRRAMVRPGRERLGGVVEVDESYVGGEEQGVRGRETDTKAIVAIAREVREPRGFGRVRLRRVDDASGSSLVPFVRDAVEPGAIVHTDGWGAYNGLAATGYEYTRTVISATGDPAHVSMPAVHRVAGLLSGGCSAPTRAPCATNTWTPISASSPSDSTAAHPAAAGCSSTASSNRPWSPNRRPIAH